ncbi:MAG: RnfABCDGE type electron transport complex subunit G [Prevotella sp.]|nr:RnfABCDGE type electron transport complex subunit G [Prevotella sp.]
MEKLKSSLTNMVGVLVGVALVTGGILALVNHTTEGPIQEKATQTLNNGIKEVMGTDQLNVAAPETITETIDGKEYEFVLHKAMDKNNKELGAAVETSTMGFGGDLKVLVGFDGEGNILGYTLLQHAETPGLGAKADTWFQKGQKGDIIGKNPKDKPLKVSKDRGEVDAITASTITSRAFLKAINQAYNAYAKKEVDAQSGATKPTASHQTSNNNQKEG